jgi:hypothetical protein
MTPGLAGVSGSFLVKLATFLKPTPIRHVLGKVSANLLPGLVKDNSLLFGLEADRDEKRTTNRLSHRGARRLTIESRNEEATCPF